MPTPHLLVEQRPLVALHLHDCPHKQSLWRWDGVERYRSNGRPETFKKRQQDNSKTKARSQQDNNRFFRQRSTMCCCKSGLLCPFLQLGSPSANQVNLRLKPKPSFLMVSAGIVKKESPAAAAKLVACYQPHKQQTCLQLSQFGNAEPLNFGRSTLT